MPTNQNVDLNSEEHNLATFLRALQKSVSVYDFRLIFYGPNELIERHLSESNKYYSYFDIVLCKLR